MSEGFGGDLLLLKKATVALWGNGVAALRNSRRVIINRLLVRVLFGFGGASQENQQPIYFCGHMLKRTHAYELSSGNLIAARSKQQLQGEAARARQQIMGGTDFCLTGLYLPIR